MKLRIFTWCALGLVATLAGEYIEYLGRPIFAPLPLVGVAIAMILMYPKRRLVIALSSSLLLLLLAKSTLSPGILESTGPIWVCVLLGLALGLQAKALDFPRQGLVVLLLALMFLIPTAVQGDLSTTAKAAGISLAWLFAFLASTNLKSSDRRVLLSVILWAGCFEALIAIGESLLNWAFIRDFIAGSADEGGYIVRPNVILGDWTNRAQGTVGYAIPFGAFIVIAILIAIVSDLISSRSLKWITVGLLSVALLLSGARSAIVALALGIAVLLVVSIVRARKAGRKPPMLVGTLIAFGALVVLGLGFFVKAMLTADFSLSHRGGVVASAANMFTLPAPQVLFGSGYNSAQKLFDAGILHTEGLGVVDNTFLTQFIFSGEVGVALLLCTIVLAFVRSDVLGRAALAAFTTLFFFYDIFNWHLSTFVLFVFVGYAFSQNISSNSEVGPETDDSPSRVELSKGGGDLHP